MKFDDLLSVPYKGNGRDMTGLDCYGLVLECCRRSGLDLHDVAYANDKVEKSLLQGYVEKLNVKEVKEPREGVCVQCEYEGRLHIAFMINSKEVIHATYAGVRISPVAMLKNVKYFEVGK